MKSIEELVAQVKQSTYPDWNVDIDRYLLEFATRFLAAYTEQQKPVAEVIKPDDWLPSFIRWIGTPSCPTGTKLYAAPVVPADMVLVRREPTNAMLSEAFKVTRYNEGIGSGADLYKAMIAAGEVKP